MHVATGGTLKGTWFGELASCPREGTRRRELYDLFKANEGIPIRAKFTRADRGSMCALQDSYGLDIRCLRRGPGSIWVLAGEWFGSEYVDYIARCITERSRA